MLPERQVFAKIESRLKDPDLKINTNFSTYGGYMSYLSFCGFNCRYSVKVISIVVGFGLAASVASAQTFLSEDALLATIPGSSVSSKTDKGVPWVQNYSAAKGKRKGVIKGNFDGSKYDAKWFVKDGQWCENWGDGEGCWSVEQVDAKSLRMYVDGKPRPNLWKLK